MQTSVKKGRYERGGVGAYLIPVSSRLKTLAPSLLQTFQRKKADGKQSTLIRPLTCNDWFNLDMDADYIETSHDIISSAVNWQPLGLVVFGGSLLSGSKKNVVTTGGRYFRDLLAATIF